MMENDVLSKKEACKFLKISIATLDRLIRRKEIPFLKLNGRVLFLREDLIKWLKSKRVVNPDEI
ncbi:MAG TPA: DNA-binding protein [Candidatus Atribacteria bacterium]|nr:DNA-binding protein [Candidatus Atribacteria bacterium]